MSRIAWTLALALFLVGGVAWGSGPIGGYLIADKIILSPSVNPTTIQIWGSFTLATNKNGRAYSNPERGYLYYKAPKGLETICRREWNDLQKSVGKGQVIGFGSSHEFKTLGKVRKADQKPESPDDYPLENGLVSFGKETNQVPIRNLLSLPAPRTPAEGELVTPGEITLVVGNIADKKRTRTEYVFTLQSASGDKEEGKVAAGDKETKWTPKRKLKAGEKYTWSVRATELTWMGPVATSRFVVKGEK